jgi:hypothetical protein
MLPSGYEPDEPPDCSTPRRRGREPWKSREAPAGVGSTAFKWAHANWDNVLRGVPRNDRDERRTADTDRTVDPSA